MSTESQPKYKDIDDYMKQEGIPPGMRDTLEIIYLQNPPAPWEETKPNIKKPQIGKTDKEGVLILNPTKEGGKESIQSNINTRDPSMDKHQNLSLVRFQGILLA